MTIKLNLGCGDNQHPGYVNVDMFGAPDVVCDLSAFPWPWETNSVDEIRAEHFLEHVDDYAAMNLEIHRILKPGGLLWFRVPHFRNPMAVWHLHKWAFSTCTPKLLCQALPYQWSGKSLFDMIELRINFAFIPERNLRNRCFKRVLSALANLSPFHWDWLGLPIDEIEFKGRKR